jgi:hypothetical protein
MCTGKKSQSYSIHCQNVGIVVVRVAGSHNQGWDHPQVQACFTGTVVWVVCVFLSVATKFLLPNKCQFCMYSHLRNHPRQIFSK